jgi:predicted TIM-barrel fold metal-dependent hydrolase
MKPVPTIDAHHHIWRLNDLPWLSGPQKLWTDYKSLYRTFRNAIAHLGESEQAAILHGTAARLYRL